MRRNYEKTELTNMCMIYDDAGNILVQDRVSKSWGVLQGSTFDDVLKIKKLKANKNGKFEKKYYLESVIK